MESSHKAAADRLAAEFDGTFSRETVESYLLDSAARWDDAPVRTHVTILAERFTRERLQAAAQSEGRMTKDVPEVLFVCVHNAGRSQMAAALLDHHSMGKVHVRSAGSAPANEIDPAVGAVMEEIGVDADKSFPKPLTEEVVAAADVVVTMGCGDACPVFPGIRYLDWDVPDPHGRPIEDVREIRDAIEQRVMSLMDELVPASRP